MRNAECVGNEVYQLRPILEAQGRAAVYVEQFAPPFEVASAEMLLPDVEDEEG